MKLEPQHLGIYCRDIEESRAFYVDKLGFKHLFSSNAMEGDKPLKMCWVKGWDNVVFELLEQEDKETIDAAHACLNHLAIRTDDMDAVVALLIEQGIPIEAGPFDPPLEFDRPLSEEERGLFAAYGDKGTQLRILFFRGPSGERFEIMQDCIGGL